ncbi:hypothetical protein CA51_35140 [Rosistilla oblonga]|uniref:DUF4254 domain-containing protein n=1 Tax=Rosistilla oblonga TaxID=2527990 RepID=A0A518IYM0_9BACT|nr:DUF4254 domain-containing protein [Rosistilla oblonga]QDV13623.1 hypothetical protein CA51_35140 [Rosistilla oblonga]QDV58185.1 hypothetical protein Mal33_42020 [Rosistilla oblonga]
MTLPIDVDAIVQLQAETVAQWHCGPIVNRYSDFMQLVCQQHEHNYRLWHQEDIARAKDVSDAEIAQVKRNIDGLNQKRNDWIEKLDDSITLLLAQQGVETAEDAPINTETSGSAIDRLSIMSLRLYHYEEQLERDDASDAHRELVTQRIALCQQQQADLSNSLKELLVDLFAGRKAHRTYRQMKMYNDPTLNPYLYAAKQLRAG